jgi:hypothetical protein
MTPKRCAYHTVRPAHSDSAITSVNVRTRCWQFGRDRVHSLEMTKLATRGLRIDTVTIASVCVVLRESGQFAQYFANTHDSRAASVVAINTM